MAAPRGQPRPVPITVRSGREAGSFRISLRAGSADGGDGDPAAHVHEQFEGFRFAKLVPNELIVELSEFETEDPALRGEMKVTITLAEAEGGGTEVVATHEGLPPGVPTAGNEAGWRLALAKLAAFVEEPPTEEIVRWEGFAEVSPANGQEF